MLDQVLDLLRTADKKNISIVWQLVQSNESLLKDLQKWYFENTKGAWGWGHTLPVREEKFIMTFEYFKWKQDTENKQWSIIMDLQTKYYLTG